jgi:hypothetical protein
MQLGNDPRRVYNIFITKISGVIMLFHATVESVAGPLSLCVSVDLVDSVLAKIVMLDEVCVRDVECCVDWLRENLVGERIVCYVNRIAKSSIYLCDVEWKDEDLAKTMIDEGLVD